MTFFARYPGRPSSTSAWALICLLIILCLPCKHHALQTGGAVLVEPPPTGISSKKRLVIISTVSNETDTQSLERSISSQLADLQIEIIFHHAPDTLSTATHRDESAISLMKQHDAVASFIILPGDNRVDLRIIQQHKDGVETVQRPVNVSQGTPQHEALAVIVRSTAMALIEQNGPEPSVAKTKSAPRKKLIVQTSPHVSTGQKKQKRPPYLYGIAGGALGLFSSGTVPWLGMAVGLGGFPTRALFLDAGFIAFSHIEKKAHDLSLTLKRHPIYIGGGYYRSFKQIFWGAGLSMLLSYVTLDISSSNDKYITNKGDEEFTFSLVGYLQLGTHLLGPISGFIDMGAEVPIQQISYSLQTLNGKKKIVTPLPVQPLLKIGLKANFF